MCMVKIDTIDIMVYAVFAVSMLLMVLELFCILRFRTAEISGVMNLYVLKARELMSDKTAKKLRKMYRNEVRKAANKNVLAAFDQVVADKDKEIQMLKSKGFKLLGFRVAWEGWKR